MTYYNDNDTYCTRWLQNLMDAGHISQGVVDGRRIEDVQPDDLTGYTRCHFFAGIAGWELALELAGWPEDRPVWTGSCPCQPFSQAGKRRGVEDDRHVWPVWRELIAKRRPPTIFGEQVASKDGRVWLAGVRADLEALGYRVGAADLCAASVGAPHIRQRLWWVADAISGGWVQRPLVPDINSEKRAGVNSTKWGADRIAIEVRPPDRVVLGEWRPQPDAVAEANGVPETVGQLRAYGNAIVPQVAAEFIRSFMETEL